MLEYLPRIEAKIEQNPYKEAPWQDAFGLIKDLRDEHPSECLEHTMKLRKMVVDYLMNDKTLDKAHQYFEQTLWLAARDDLDSFMQYIEWNIAPDKRFYQPRRKVLNKYLIPHLMDLEYSRIHFLGVSMPPRVGKSRSCKEFMAWHMGRHPDDANAMCGYSKGLAQGFYDDILELVSSADYRFADVFPDAPFVHKSAEYLQINLRKKKSYASLTCRGIEGAWTGAVDISSKNGILYCDDLIIDEEEASSMVRLESKYSAYINHVKDRKGDEAKELMVGTRWNVYDPLGQMEAFYEGRDDARFVVIPALNEEGESNFAYSRNGFSTEYYNEVKRSTDDVFFQAKYMGNPYLREGLLYKTEELKRFYDLPEGEPDAVISVCDTKDAGADFFAAPIGYLYNGQCYIVDCICDDGLPDAVKPRITAKYMEHKVQQARFESNSAGGEIARDIQRRLKEAGGITNITTAFTSKNKETKILVNSDWVKANCLFWDKTKYPNEDYKRFMNFLTTYSVSGKNKHDDAPDSMAMLALFVPTFQGNRVEVFDRWF